MLARHGTIIRCKRPKQEHTIVSDRPNSAQFVFIRVQLNRTQFDGLSIGENDLALSRVNLRPIRATPCQDKARQSNLAAFEYDRPDGHRRFPH
jgi:hypothetical protein